MNMKITRLNEQQYFKFRIQDADPCIEYYNNADKLHRSEGPATIHYLNSRNSMYLEWWNDGKLVATFDKEKNLLKKANNESSTVFYEVVIPKNWQGLEDTLSLEDLGFCNNVVLSHKNQSNPFFFLTNQIS